MAKHFMLTRISKPGAFRLDKLDFQQLAKKVPGRSNLFPTWPRTLEIPGLTTLSGLPASFSINIPVATVNIPLSETGLNTKEKPKNEHKFIPYLKAAIIVLGMIISCLMYSQMQLVNSTGG